jgi:hypothetical protein
LTLFLALAVETVSKLWRRSDIQTKAIDKSDVFAKDATTGMDDQLFVSKYLVKLPEKKVLENFMKRELNR